MYKFFQSTNRDQSQTGKIRKMKKQSVFVNVIILVMVVLFGGIYLAKTNTIAVEGYKVDDLQKNIDKLKEENKKLELKSIELRSVVNLENKIKELKMVKVEQFNHINPVVSSVALR